MSGVGLLAGRTGAAGKPRHLRGLVRTLPPIITGGRLDFPRRDIHLVAPLPHVRDAVIQQRRQRIQQLTQRRIATHTREAQLAPQVGGRVRTSRDGGQDYDRLCVGRSETASTSTS